MKYQQLGNSALTISRIGFGCMSLHGDGKQHESLIDRALEYGINYFDTADLYDKGANEEMIGRLLRKRRQQIIIATKAGNQWREDGSGWDWNPRKKYILSAVEKSLIRLQTDYIDLYQLHGGTIDDPIDETIEAFEWLKQQGKIRYYGISSIRPNVIREYVKRSSIISVMMQYSLLDRRPEEACLPLLHKQGIGVVARGSVAQGLLLDKEPREYLGHTRDEVKTAADAIHKLAASPGDAASVAIRYTLHHPAVKATVVGMHSLEQLQDAVRAIEMPELNESEYSQLQNSAGQLRYEQHK